MQTRSGRKIGDENPGVSAGARKGATTSRAFGVTLQNKGVGAKGGKKELLKGGAVKPRQQQLRVRDTEGAAPAAAPPQITAAPAVVAAPLLPSDFNMSLEVDLDNETGLCNMSLDESLEVELNAPLVPPSAAAAPVQQPADVDNIDELDEDDPQYVVEYVNDIYVFLRAKEARYALDASYMQKTQKDITPSMRGILLDWLCDVGNKFRLLNDTTHMTSMLIDRYLSIAPNVSRKRLQLIGVTAMLIASKYEEIYAPEVKDFEYICDGAFSHQEILDMEVHMLNTMNFDICHPTPIHFLRRFSKAARSDSESHTVSKYLTEMAAIEYESLRYVPSLIAAAAVYLGRMMHEQPDEPEFTWSTTMQHYTQYSKAELRPAVLSMAAWARDLQQGKSKLTAVFRKYGKKFFGVANFPVPADSELF